MNRQRVELHLHTNMSAMDGINTAFEYIEEAKERGMSAIAITDHGVVQAFPEAYKAAKRNDMKLIYGMEGYFVNDKEQIVFGNPNDKFNGTFVIVDIETTGLDCKKDKIIEIAACKIRDKEIVEKFSSLVNPGIDIPKEIEELTGITNEMVAESPDIKTVLKQFIDFCEGHTLVAHNAQFDIGFISKVLKENGISLNPCYIDTLALARFLLPEYRCHKLSVLCRELEIENESEHRAAADAEVTAKILVKFFDMLEEKGISDVSKIDDSNDVPYYKGKRYHITILVENKVGLKNLYRLVSKSHTEHFWRRPIILRSELTKYGEGLLYGSACSEGEIFEAILEGKSDEELDRMSDFYNFLEVQPIENNKYLIKTGQMADEEGLRELNRRIVELGERNAKMVVASGDVHFLNTDDGECRKILMHSRGYEGYDNQPDMRLKSTEEMLEEFSYLGEDTAKEIVIRTPNIIADLVDDDIEPFPQTNNYPKMKDSEERITMWSYIGARRKYGENIPSFVEERLKWELDKIIENGYADLYMIACEMVKSSHRKGYIVGSRGSIASSIVSYFLGSTETNPVAPHYYCGKCGYSELRDNANCGCDLPDKICPECGQELLKDGFNIPAETFMGADGDRVPDIDLNFATEIRDEVEKRLKKQFGAENIVRAGTISSTSEKIAEQYVLNYCKDKNIAYSDARVEEYIWKLRNVKRTTGLHPGGTIIIPEGKEILDFTPVNYPANDINSDIVTTHFDYYALCDCLYKFDILMHDTPSILRKLEQLTGINPETIPLNDEKTMELFSKGKTCGVPEFYTEFVRNMMKVTGVNSFDDLIRISGLSHGTDVWIGNGEYAIEDGVKLSDLISTRDDITIYLERCGYDRREAFKIAERVRKGIGLTEEQEEEMCQKGIPDWYIDSCNTVKYLFPRAHALSYVLLAYRVAYFKAHRPLEFYCSYFTMNADRFDADLLINNSAELKEKIMEYKESDESSKREMRYVMEVCQEMYDEGYGFVSDKIKNEKFDSFFIEDGKIRPKLKYN
jgi:DNA polymerase-3 subunit alpha (Gram-positive type)